jgi:DNA-directed RNA polymerase subunit RPC12/RpoP
MENTALQDKETYERFGYLATQLSVGSNKRVVYKCKNCGELVETRRYRVKTGLCKICTAKVVMTKNWDERRKKNINTFGQPAKTWNCAERIEYTCIDCGKISTTDKGQYAEKKADTCKKCTVKRLWEERRTKNINQFGTQTKFWNKNEIVEYICVDCGELKKVEKYQYKESNRCKVCSARLTMRTIQKRFHDQGITTRGKPLGVRKPKDPLKIREWSRNARIRTRSTLEGKLRHNIQTAIRRAINTKRLSTPKGACFTLLPYNRMELKNHIQSRLANRNNLCPLCGIDISNSFVVDHKDPIKNAKTVEEIIYYFRLENLDVLCWSCNSSKGAKHVEY